MPLPAGTTGAVGGVAVGGGGAGTVVASAVVVDADVDVDVDVVTVVGAVVGGTGRRSDASAEVADRRLTPIAMLTTSAATTGAKARTFLFDF
jgi:hypothetical protein